MDIKVVFLGSPEFALPTLRTLVDQTRVVGVVTQPDRPAGRGQRLEPPPVKVLAEEFGIPVLQPERLKEPQALAQLEAWKPDLIIVAAFGQILRKNVLTLPHFGCINVHASLLPRWRGAAPIQAAILHGDVETGVTIMQMDVGLDTGPWLNKWTTPISSQDTAGTLSVKLAEGGANLLMETLPGYLSGEIKPQPQEDALATYAPMIQKEEGRLDFTQPADALTRRVRAFQPWPGAFLEWEGQTLKVLRARAAYDIQTSPGQRFTHLKLPAIGTANGTLILEEVQPAGKKAMPGQMFLNGARNWNQSFTQDRSSN